MGFHPMLAQIQRLQDLSWRLWTLSPRYSCLKLWPTYFSRISFLTFKVWLLNSVKFQSLSWCPYPFSYSAIYKQTPHRKPRWLYGSPHFCPSLKDHPSSMYEKRSFLYFVWYSSCLQEDNSGPYDSLILRSRSLQQTVCLFIYLILKISLFLF